MKKTLLILTAFVLILNFKIVGQSFQASIKKGSTTSSYKIFLKCNQAYSGIFTNINFNIQVPSSVTPAPSISILNNITDPSGIGQIKLFGTLSYDFSGKAGSTLPGITTEDNFHNYIFSANGNTTANQPIAANTEFELLEISFSAGVSNARVFSELAASDVRIGQPSGGGSTGAQVLYIQGALSDITNNTAPFYGSGAVNDPNAYSYVSALTTTTLPLTLLSFTGEQQKGNAYLKWKTESELNVDRFIVSKSNDGQAFVNIGEVKANNNTGKEITAYSFTTEQKEEIAYYRLKMIDMDGSYDYSKIIALKNKEAENAALSVAPNPIFTDKISVSYTASNTEGANLSLVTALGEVITNNEINVNAGSNKFEINNLGHLTTGLYMVHLKTKSGLVSSAKVLK